MFETAKGPFTKFSAGLIVGGGVFAGIGIVVGAVTHQNYKHGELFASNEGCVKVFGILLNCPAPITDLQRESRLVRRPLLSHVFNLLSLGSRSMFLYRLESLVWVLRDHVCITSIDSVMHELFCMLFEEMFFRA